MIVTVTLNPALDVTHELAGVRLGATNRIARVHERAGGKGLNVARVLSALGEPVLACGLLGGRTGEAIRAELEAAGIAAAFITVAAESRRTVAIVEPARTTLLNEPGPQVAPEEWTAFLAGFGRLVCDASVAVASGSLPPGVPTDAYAVLGELCRAAGVELILDADGEPLLRGLTGRPSLIKPNADELARLASGPPADAAQRLRAAGAGAVVVSQGPDGLLALTPHGAWRAVPPTVTGNPTGAGDALVAALAQGHAHGRPWPERLRHGAALSAAAVRAAVAGTYDPADYETFLPLITLESL